MTTDFDIAYANDALQARQRAKYPPVQAASVYLLRHWARYLGAEGLMAVLAARQMAFEQQPREPGRARVRQWQGEAAIQATQETLSRRAAMAETTLRRVLKRPAVRLFLQAVGSVCSSGRSGSGVSRVCSVGSSGVSRVSGGTKNAAYAATTNATTNGAFWFHPYRVLMGDPLAPHHAAGLARYLRAVMAEADAGGGATPENRAAGRRLAAYQALSEFLERPSGLTRGMLEGLARPSPQGRPSPNLSQGERGDWRSPQGRPSSQGRPSPSLSQGERGDRLSRNFSQGERGERPSPQGRPSLQGRPSPNLSQGERGDWRCHTVLEIVEALGLLPEAETERRLWEGLCEKAQAALTAPERVLLVSRRFWKEWLPRLRATRAALLLNLRSRCFYDPAHGERRDRLNLHYDELSREVGVSPRQARRLLMARAGVARRAPLGGFIRVIEYAQKRRPPFVQILMLDPFLSDMPDKTLPDGGQNAPLEGANAGQIAPDTNKHFIFKHLTELEIMAPKTEKDPSRPPDEAERVPEGLWEGARWRISLQTTQATYDMFIKPLKPLAFYRPPGADKAVIWLAHPHPYGAEWVEKRMARKVGEALEEGLGSPVEFRVVARINELPRPSHSSCPRFGVASTRRP